MSNVLSEEKKQQVVAMEKLGWPLRRIEQATGVRRETASAYLKAVGIAIRAPGGWGKRGPAIPSKEGAPSPESKPANGVTTDPQAEVRERPPETESSCSRCEPFRETIELGLSRGRNAMAIWQDLVTDNAFEGGYETVKRFVRKLRGTRGPEASGIIITGLGEEAQSDYGTGPKARDPQTGKYRRTRLFVLTLGYSRKSVVFCSSARVWAQLHETAFRRLGGSPSVIVC